MTGTDAALRRHNEIRTALRFFLQSWYKHRQNTSVAEPRAVLSEFLRFKAYTASLQTLNTIPGAPGSKIPVQTLDTASAKPADSRGRRRG